MNIKKLSAIVMSCVMLAAFSACSADSETDAKTDNAQKNVQSSAGADIVSTSDAQTNTKYGQAPTYQNEDGKTVAKTESGTEVELSGESLAEIYAEYEKVKGTGSDKEKELLDQLQLILEASPNINQVQ